MLPVVTEVVFVDELFLHLEAKLRELHLFRVVTKTNSTNLSNTVSLAVNDELMEVAVSPARVQFVECSGDRQLCCHS